MPTELREIAFRESEFFNAVRDYRLRRGEPLPVGSVLGIDLNEDPSLSAIIRIGDDDGASIETIALQAESIAAALILLCINRKIPLPAHADKSVLKAGDNVILKINITAENYYPKKAGTKIPDLPYLRGAAPDRGRLN